MLRKCAYWVNRLLWTVLITALVLVATYVSIGRYYIAYIEQYQHELIEKFVSYTGLPLTAQRLHGQWSKLSPILTMENLALHPLNQLGEPVLIIDEISFQLDPLGSLLNRRLQVKQLQLNGVHCELEEIERGRWQLKGYPTQGGETDFDKVIDLVLSVDKLQLLQGVISMHYFKGDTALFESKELSLLHENDFRRLRLQATFDKAENPLLAVIEAQGDPRDIELFSAKAYLKLDDVDFTNQLPLIRALGINLHNAEVDSEVWVDWQPNRIISVQGAAAISQIDWAAIVRGSSQPQMAAPELKKPPLENVALSFRAERSLNNHWQVWLPSVQAQWNTQHVSFEQLHIGVNSQTIDVALPVISLDTLVDQITDLNVLGEKNTARLRALSPIGTLNNVHLQIALPKVSTAANNTKKHVNPPFLLTANLDQVGINAWKGAPGAKGINGFIEVAPTYGVVEFNSQQLSMNFSVVYNHWLGFDQARGLVRWDIETDRVKVKSGPMYLQADYGPATGLLNLDLPIKAGAGDPQMTLTIGLRDTAAHHRTKLIPRTLNKDFLNWMEKSVPKGHIVDAGFIYRGSLLKKAHDQRTVQLYFNIDKTTLDYHPKWPKLHDIRALVSIDNATVNVSTQQAKMFGLNVESAHVNVVPLDDGMWLSVDAKASGDGSDALKVVTQSAIRDRVGSAFDSWILKGPTAADVKLGVPLAGAKADTQIDVNVSLNNNELQLPDFRVVFNQLSGPLHFSSDKGLSSSGLGAQLYGKPIAVTVESAADKSVLVDINGRVDMADVGDWSGQPAMTFVTGVTDFNAKVVVEDKGEGYFSVNSTLVGVDIDLPAPFNKIKDNEHPFWLTLPLHKDNALLQMGLENQVQLQVQLDQGNFSSALVNVETHGVSAQSVTVSESNVPPSRLQQTDLNTTNLQHEPGVFIVTGHGPNVQLEQWQKVLERYLQAAEQTTDSSSRDIPIRVRGLSLTGISCLGRHFDQTVVSAERRKKTWWLAITNSLTSGEIIIPDDKNTPYTIDLQRLYFPEIAGKDGLSTLDPTNFAAVDISIADVAIGDEHYGNIAFNLRSDNQGAHFENLTGNIRGAHIRSSNPAILHWTNHNGVTQSHLTAQLDVGDLGKVLENWRYENIIASETGNIKIDLNWQGRPDQWTLQNSEGTIDVVISDGRFFAASDTASGTLKVVGIVNLANIVRRLKLDFTDFYKTGISFDKINGRLQLLDKQLTIVDEINVKSPSSSFRLHGNANLEKELLDMELIVTLPVANNLPWIAALAGGLPTAAGVFVASKIFEEQFDRLSSAVYTVGGDWNNPELKFKRVFDQKKKTKTKKNSKEDAIDKNLATSKKNTSDDSK